MPITAAEVGAILLGTEHGGNENTIYRVSLASTPSTLAPDGNYREENGQINNSAFSFGLSQLDIGRNPTAQAAYTEILNSAIEGGVIDAAQQDRLMGYVGVQRPDLDPRTSGTYAADLAFLNEHIFSRPETREIVDRRDAEHINEEVFPQVQEFLDEMSKKWGTDTVFDPANPDYRTAEAAIVSIANRTGNLEQTEEHFLKTQPDSLDDVQARFGVVFPARSDSNPDIPRDWSLVQRGGDTIQALDFIHETQSPGFDTSSLVPPVPNLGQPFDELPGIPEVGSLVPPSPAQDFGGLLSIPEADTPPSEASPPPEYACAAAEDAWAAAEAAGAVIVSWLPPEDVCA